MWDIGNLSLLNHRDTATISVSLKSPASSVASLPIETAAFAKFPIARSKGQWRSLNSL